MPRSRKPEAELPAPHAANTDELNAHIDALELRYRRQFNALDTLINSLRSSTRLLSQQLARLPKLDK